MKNHFIAAPFACHRGYPTVFIALLLYDGLHDDILRLCLCEEGAVAFLRLIDLDFARRLPGRMHREAADAAVYDLHAAEAW